MPITPTDLIWYGKSEGCRWTTDARRQEETAVALRTFDEFSTAG